MSDPFEMIETLRAALANAEIRLEERRYLPGYRVKDLERTVASIQFLVAMYEVDCHPDEGVL